MLNESNDTFMTGCCPPFDPTPWHDGLVTWDNKPFLKTRVKSVLHIPLWMGRKVMRAMAQIEGAGARPVRSLMLTDTTSPWATDLFIEVTRVVPGAEMAWLSGTFVTRVFDGSYRDAALFACQTQRELEHQGRTVEKIYLAWTMCPRCAKAYGHNYAVVFAKVEPVVGADVAPSANAAA